MDKYMLYEQLTTAYAERGISVSEYKEISYGIQFNVYVDGNDVLLRIYKSKKKGVNIDYSQIKKAGIQQKLKTILKEFNEPPKNNKAKGKKTKSKKIAEENTKEKTKEKTQQIPHDISEEMTALIGVDESGKGDYFGPLVIAGVYATLEQQEILKQMGVADSKQLRYSQIKKLAPQIKELCQSYVLCLNNTKYNILYERINNLNTLLAKSHIKVIDELVTLTGCSTALSDQFARKNVLQTELELKGTNVKLLQKTKGESNVVVAAASILARDKYVSYMEAMEKHYGVPLPKGCGPAITAGGRAFVRVYGTSRLHEVAKLHFKTTDYL